MAEPKYCTTADVMTLITPADGRALLASLARFALYDASSTSSSTSSYRDVTSRLSASSAKLERDEVVRVLDGGNAIKLRRGGTTKFGAVRTPTGYGSVTDGGDRFPECLDRSPAYGARRLLPPGTAVAVRYLDDGSASSSSPRPAIIVRVSDGTVTNLELVRTGFAKPTARDRDAAERIVPGWTAATEDLRNEARVQGAGMYMRCSDADSGVVTLSGGGGGGAMGTIKIDLDEQFEPLEAATAIEWGADGGRTVLRTRDRAESVPPPNPGDVKGCSDFGTYEDALRWYERYEPYYGDVARLDRDGDGIPCPGLPHTRDKERYRMKIPRTRAAAVERGNKFGEEN